MKTLFKAFVAATALLAFTQVQAADAAVPKYDDPYKMMEVLADKTFQRIARQQAEIKKDPEILRTIVTEELVPYIDSRYAAGYVIGNAVKLNTVPKQDFNTFVTAFQNYMVGTYAGVFTQYRDQQVMIEPGQAIEAQKKIITIRTRVIDPGKPDIKIEFKLRRVKDANNWLVFDMVAEGISLLDSKRSELGSMIRQQGLVSVAALLEEKAKAPIKAPEKAKNA
ncbi:MlaC/ttg2D family ABC transporter substrate-binding protein [Rheinheimera texasensis]|jgi:phospholipid transport system substrate-binding protein|uniref:MlaC/ttg2D family ABC transporter substrate-binding protein n=1 Tax=Rheinheimera texasensis TaxID=306205 RepID=UPI0004E18085|nr:ABC transporter substrate-binding protein [Rheinheimera texasensis]